ncbi:MAG: radical SAM protein [Desulfovibrio sp.]|nr:radical SAM protein [Desulfovibrio sp.]
MHVKAPPSPGVLPWPRHPRGGAVVPVFMPFRGCPVRCVFCAQQHTTGRPEKGPGVAALLSEAEKTLTARRAAGKGPAELAFFGGTFTALPRDEFAQCLAFAKSCRQNGLITAFRCSTRPDRMDETILDELSLAGCATVELGIQSFSDAALSAGRRGYVAEEARRACALIASSSIKLGVQLLPGMPESTPATFREDVATALSLGCAMLRFYPCLVLRDTALADLWREGLYSPWGIEETLAALAEGWLAARAAGVPVIRMGLAPEPGLKEAVLAGPVHPDLGARVMGRALYLAVTRAMNAQGMKRLARLEAPGHTQGYFHGHGGELDGAWAAIGLGRGAVRFNAEDLVRLYPE